MKFIKQVESFTDSRGYPLKMGVFMCDYCKKEFIKPYNAKRYKSCGCARGIHQIKHALANTKIYHTWEGMIQRCTNAKAPNYKYYGAKGIKICKEWLESFSKFSEWALINGFKNELQIDRINCNGDYSPKNCRFVTAAQNSRNRSNNRLKESDILKIRALHISGENNQRELASMYNVNQSYISQIVNNKVWKNI